MTASGKDSAAGGGGMKLYDTMSRSEKSLRPSDGKTLRFYCCGPTVYGPAHIGNFRTFVMQDVFRRTVEALGIATKHVRNITDVDDKTIRQSQAEGRALGEFCALWTQRFHEDGAALNLLPPHVEPGAVEHIGEQLALIERLVAGGFAYVGGDGSVYFRIASFPNYGRLSRLAERTTTTETNALAGLDDEYERESAADFALWKARRPADGENFWPSPWGEGRPGWHIECSAMSMKHLGESFDLHGGGVDLIFPHHENEIAQSEAATGKLFAGHWFHVAHLLVDGRKMSKSLGNLYTLDDVRDRGFSAEELRYVLLSGSYRQPLNFTWESLSAAKKALARLREFGRKLGSPVPAEPGTEFGVFRPVLDALSDDLNTPEALGRLFTLVRELHPGLDRGEVDAATLEQWRAGFAAVLRVFGFTLQEPDRAEVPPEIEDLAKRRWQAKLDRDWAAADALRDELSRAGWQVKDAAGAYELSRNGLS